MSSGLPGTLTTNLPPPTDGLRWTTSGDTEAWIGPRCLGNGALYVAESRLAWSSCQEASVSFSLNYPSVSLHGVSKGDSDNNGSNIRPHLYLLVRGNLLGDGDGDGEDDDSDGDGDEDKEEATTEIRFCPADPAALMSIFQAVGECQALHPDEEDAQTDSEDDGEDEGEGEGYGDDEFVGEGYGEDGDNGEGEAGEGEDEAERPGRVSSGDAGPPGHQPMDTDQFEDAA